MPTLNMTMEERERRAYIEGRTQEAELLAQLADSEVSAEIRDWLEDMGIANAEELEKHESAHEEKISALEAKVEDHETEIETLKDTVFELETERDELREHAHRHGLDLV